MGMPISFDLSEDEVRTKLCTAPDCRCPDCHQRRLIRLGSLTAHQHRYSRSGQMGGIHAGYIFTDLPDYRFRHALNAETQVPAASTRDNGPFPGSQHVTRGSDSHTGSEAQRTTTGEFHEETLTGARTLTNASSSTATATATAATATAATATAATATAATVTAATVTAATATAATATAATATAAASPQTSLTSVSAVEARGAVVLDTEQQERCDDEEGTAYGRDRHQRVRAQAWATNVEGLDYYHESDQDG
ncbi:hypothetical protein BGZ67_000466 [Mortierella alpina]|nr:hypothetical protein BGZ67_000466 [Mortierella alpina]